MASSTNVDVIIGAQDNATKVIRGVGESAQVTGRSVSETFKTGGVAAAGFMAAVTGLGVAMANVASNFEQNRISFETMLGSAEAGRKALANLSDFAVKTPFELPQLITASKSLLAYGIEADNLIPTLRNLGDIASGVGMDKLPQLILAFGQVKAATKLTGMELRQFTEAGVPLLQALVDQANKAGGSWVTVGGVSEKTKAKLDSLNDTLAKQSNRLKEMTDKGKTGSAAYQNLNIDIQNTRDKIAALGDTTGKTSKVFQKTTVTVEQMKDMITEGKVSFDQVQAALQGMTGEGGKFFNLMEKQSKTFGGVMSNIKDQVTRSLAEIAGVDIAQGGIIREGSLFAVMKDVAEGALAALNKFTPVFVDFTQKLLANKQVVLVLAGVITGALVVAVGGLIAVFGAGLLILGKFILIGGAIAAVVGTVVEAFGGWEKVSNALKEPINALINGSKALFGALGDLMNALKPLGDFIKTTILPIVSKFLIDAIKRWIETMTVLIQWITKVIEAFRDFVNFVNSGELSKAVESQFNRAKSAVTSFVEGTKSSLQSWLDSSRSVFEQFKTTTSNMFTGWIEGTKAALEPWKQNFLLTLETTLTDVSKRMLDYNLETTARWQQTMLDWGKAIGDGLLKIGADFQFWLESLPEKITNGLLNAGAAFQFWLESLGGTIANGLLNVGASFQAWLESLPQLFTTGLTNLGNVIWSNLTAFWARVTTGWNTNGISSIEALTKGILDSEPSMSGKIVEMLLKFIALVLVTLVVGFIDVGIRATAALGKSIVEGIDRFKSSVEDAINRVIDAIRNLINGFRPKFTIGLDLPDIEGAWNSLKNRAKQIGIPGFQTGGIVPGPIGSPQLALVHGGEEIKPVGTTSTATGGGGANISFNVTVGMYAGSETEKRNIARQLYGALLQLAQSQHKSVAEMMGG